MNTGDNVPRPVKIREHRNLKLFKEIDSERNFTKVIRVGEENRPRQREENSGHFDGLG